MSATTFVRLDESTSAKGKKSDRNYFFGSRDGLAPGPEGFMLKFAPEAGLPAHFHDVNQFQVFFGSRGATFQRHQIPELMVHYSAAGTLYGPFAAGDEVPLQMLTLRQAGSQFTGLMPNDRDRLAGPDKRKHLEGTLSSWLEDPLPAAGQSTCLSVYPDQADGVAAFAILAGPNAAIASPDADRNGDRYYVVVDGEMRQGDRVLPPLSIGWSTGDDELPSFQAGDSGVRLLVMQFAPALAA